MRFAADENFDGRILDGLRRRLTPFDVVRVQDTPMYQSSDPELLDWLAAEGRILLTHDVNTNTFANLENEGNSVEKARNRRKNRFTKDQEVSKSCQICLFPVSIHFGEGIGIDIVGEQYAPFSR